MSGPRKSKSTSEGIAPGTVSEEPKPRGRPTAYTAALAEEILDRMHNGESLNEICRGEHMPNERTVRRWNMDDVDGFSPKYARARDALIEYHADEILNISDNATNDWMERHNNDGEAIGWQVNGDHVSRSKLRVESRKWLLSKLRPDRYGDRVQHSGDGGGPIQHQVGVSWMTEDQAKARGWA